MILLVLLLIVGAIATILVVRGTVFIVMYSERWLRHSRPDVFPRPSQCSRCERPISLFEGVRTFRELLLGGWTCPGCGSVYDQLGDVRLARARNAHLHDMRERARSEELREVSADDRTPVEKLFDE